MADGGEALDWAADEPEAAMEEERAEPAGGKRRKGRGFKDGDKEREFGGAFEALEEPSSAPGPARSVEGWIVLATGVHEEAQEDDVYEAFAEHGEVKNLHLNLDRRTGFVKGYALVEYETRKEAEAAIAALNGATLLAKQIAVSWAFSRGPLRVARSG